MISFNYLLTEVADLKRRCTREHDERIRFEERCKLAERERDELRKLLDAVPIEAITFLSGFYWLMDFDDAKAAADRDVKKWLESIHE